MSRFVKVADVAEIPAGTVRRVVVNGTPIAVFNIADEFYAIDDTCSHAEASLSEGSIDGYKVACPRHGACFDVRTGQALSLPAFAPVATYQVKVEDGDVLIAV